MARRRCRWAPRAVWHGVLGAGALIGVVGGGAAVSVWPSSSPSSLALILLATAAAWGTAPPASSTPDCRRCSTAWPVRCVGRHAPPRRAREHAPPRARCGRTSSPWTPASAPVPRSTGARPLAATPPHPGRAHRRHRSGAAAETGWSGSHHRRGRLHPAGPTRRRTRAAGRSPHRPGRRRWSWWPYRSSSSATGRPPTRTACTSSSRAARPRLPRWRCPARRRRRRVDGRTVRTAA